MTITAERYRRFETLLIAATDVSTAELILVIVAARIEATEASVRGGSDLLVADHDVVDIDALARSIGRERKSADRWLLKADQQASRDLGFALFETPLLVAPARGAVVGLSRDFLDVIEGRTFGRVRRDDQLVIEADAATRHGLDLIVASARQNGKATFLYRVAAAMADLQISRLVEDLKRRQGTASVLLGVWEMPGRQSPSQPSLNLISVALAALLHADSTSILVLPHVEEQPRMNPSQATLDEWDEPVTPEASTAIASVLNVFLRVAMHAQMTVVLAVPEATMLDPADAAPIAGAFGPYRLDRRSAIQTIVAASPSGGLGHHQAEQILEAVGDPMYAGEILRTAEVIRTTVINGRVPDRSKLAAGPTLHSMRTRRRNTSQRVAAAGEHVRSCDYNSIVEDLARSRISHLKKPAALRDLSTAPFAPELFVSDPDSGFLFDRAAILYEAGARIIIAGPSASGKSAVVAELGRRMAVQIYQHSASSLFARGWGRAEKNIAAAIALGRGCLTFFDEADALMGSRFDNTDQSTHLTVAATSAFLTAIQDAQPRSPIVIATNRLDAIDPAIRRRGDVILTTKPLPEEREPLAWLRILKMRPPVRWQPLGGTVPGDYVKALRQMMLLGQHDAATAAGCIRRARDERAFAEMPRPKRIGFF